VKGNRYSPSYLAIIACVACFSKSISFPAIANCSAIELPVFGRIIVDVVLDDFRVRRLGLHEKNPRRGVLQLKYLRRGRRVEKNAGGERQKSSRCWSSAAHAFADKIYLSKVVTLRSCLLSVQMEGKSRKKVQISTCQSVRSTQG
jgi:hypothetical protein